MVQAQVKEPPETTRAADTPSLPPQQPGEYVASGYEVITHIRRGRHIDVYDVWSEERACRCVAKLIRPDRLNDTDARRRLLQEGWFLERLTHVHIVRAYETLLEPHPIVVLEALTGATLEYLVQESRRRLSLSDVALLGLQLCSALQYVHRKGFLHLDLKPSNIVCEKGLAKLIDFSIARPPGQSGQGMGTPQYMSPEQARGDLLSPAADVWGIGAVLFEAATSIPPFGRRRRSYENLKQLQGRADPVRAYRRLPPAFATTIDGCLDPDPAGRPTIQELSNVLVRFAGWSPKVVTNGPSAGVATG